MNCRCTLILLTVMSISTGMEQQTKPSSPSQGSKSQIVGPTRPVAPVDRHHSTKELSQSLTNSIGVHLMAAIEAGDYSEVKRLLMTQDSAANFVTKTQETPLYAALTAPKYNHKIFTKLLAYRADLMQKVKGKQPFDLAVEKENYKAALALIYAGFPITQETVLDPLFLAKELFYEIKKARVDRIRHLLALNTPVNIHSTKDPKNSLGDEDTPLLCTITDQKDFNKQLFDLILRKADTNFCARRGLSPLQKAIAVGNEIAAIELLNKAADYKLSVKIQNKEVSLQKLAQEMNLTIIAAAIEKKIKSEETRQALIKTLEDSTTENYTMVIKSPRVTFQKP